MARPQVPGNGDTEAGGRDGGVPAGRPPALDRQLRPPLRVHLRLPRLLRHPALRHLRRVRPPAEDRAAVAVRRVRCADLHRPHPPLLHQPHLRLRALQVLQLYSNHQGLL